ncbi:unnamed protein product [Caenorhabditis auriculariae]|uniref:Uncharacterized protein n=1 Tax=Caenorhabditis auriculariae TaxID=2777116 RepID=A0A8S1HY52_9PELO|nr:unnamed protein product [Caenorhabditis auriculariae]
MSAKLYSRPGVFAWSPRGNDSKGLIVADFAQYFDANAGNVQPKIEFLSSSDLFGKVELSPTASVNTNYRFNELCWANSGGDQHLGGIVAGGTEDGTVVFFDAFALINESKLEIISARRDHHGHVLSVDSSADGRWVTSGAGSGQLLLWDLANLASPYSPGVANFQDQVKVIRWCGKVDTIFASASAHRVSVWDIRRHGAPILEFAENPGCDWATLSWNPKNANTLLVGSQSQTNPVIQLWDLRYATAPLNEFRLHQRGVTSIDWHTADDRLAMSAGLDGQILIWNPENGQIHGGLGSLQGDWIKAVRWSRAQPAQLAVQYFRHPTQICSLDSLGTPQQGMEVLAPKLSESLVPSWISAPTVGSSLAMGCRHVTHWRSFDIPSQKFVFNVEVETAFVDEELLSTIETFQRAHENNGLDGFYEDMAMTTKDEVDQLSWLFLSQVKNQSRSGLLKLLGFGEPDTTTESTSDATTSSTERSEVSPTCSTYSDERNSPSLALTVNRVDFSTLEDDGWKLLDCSVNGDHKKVIEELCRRGCYFEAAYYSMRYNLQHQVLQTYLESDTPTDPLGRLALFLGVSEKTKRTEGIKTRAIQSFPLTQWKRLLALVFAMEYSSFSVQNTMKKIGLHWLTTERKELAMLPFIIASDEENLLDANQHLPLESRVFQALGLKLSRVPTAYIGPKLAGVLREYALVLANNGIVESAWKLVADFGDCQEQEFLETRYALWHAAGGRECTGTYLPPNPWQPKTANTNTEATTNTASATSTSAVSSERVSQRTAPVYSPTTSIPPPPPGPRHSLTSLPTPSNPGLVPMPPSSMFYQTPSWDHKPPPPSPRMPPQAPIGPVTPGWNDPPPMMAKKVAPPPAPVMQMHWTPLEPSATGAFSPVMNNRGPPSLQVPSVYNSPSTGPPSNNTITTSSPSPAQKAPLAPLSPEDQLTMDQFYQLTSALLAASRAPATVNKAQEIQKRLHEELHRRFSEQRLSLPTRSALYYIADHTSKKTISKLRRRIWQSWLEVVEISLRSPRFCRRSNRCFSLYSANFPS